MSHPVKVPVPRRPKPPPAVPPDPDIWVTTENIRPRWLSPQAHRAREHAKDWHEVRLATGYMAIVTAILVVGIGFGVWLTLWLLEVGQRT